MLDFAAALAREMRAQGHSQADAARLSTLSQPAISAYLKGTRRPDLEAFALLLRVYPRLLRWLARVAKTL